MSRTDKTDPMWVRMNDPANRLEVREVHNHTRGPCNLDTWDYHKHGMWRREGGCYKTIRPIKAFWCNCSMCSGFAWLDVRGAHRAEWRQQRQAWLQGWGEYRKERMARKYWWD